MKVISGNQINITHVRFIVNIVYSFYFKKSRKQNETTTIHAVS